MKKLLLFLFAVGLFAACQNNVDQKDLSASVVDTENMDKTRAGQQKKVKAKAYYYPSLVAFEKGQSQQDLSLTALNKINEMEQKEYNYVVLYDAATSWAEVFSTGDYSQTGNDQFNELLASHNLLIVQQFEVDDMSEGLVLAPNANVDSPVEVARELSLIQDVMMVQLKEVPAEDQMTASK
ncbi:hypothetical protein PPO43_15735 [Saprospira sp. CCB-QB6]|uniref:hypothetical protein n=1 Tax=Saprospira sp. CCB-QB6 TaxID=3023936 RepID=UPI0023493EC5|nr:hypothetical protein [Saprospira sp. CCB-QB6]WCL81427.1 hypothetical protein PPO43_15735 [Saprospira sp. CCB-QB6]